MVVPETASPRSDIGAGDVYESSIYHLLRLNDPLEVFPVHLADSAGDLIRQLDSASSKSE